MSHPLLRRRSIAFSLTLHVLIFSICPLSPFQAAPVKARDMNTLVWSESVIAGIEYEDIWHVDTAGDPENEQVFISYLVRNSTYQGGLDLSTIPSTQNASYDFMLAVYDIANGVLINETMIAHNVFAQPYTLTYDSETGQLHTAFFCIQFGDPWDGDGMLYHANSSDCGQNWSFQEISFVTYNDYICESYGGGPELLLWGNDYVLVTWWALDYTGTYSTVFTCLDAPGIQSINDLPVWDAAANNWGESQSDFTKRCYFNPTASLLDNDTLLFLWAKQTIAGTIMQGLLIDRVYMQTLESVHPLWYHGVIESDNENVTFFNNIAITPMRLSLPHATKAHVLGDTIYVPFAGDKQGGVSMLTTSYHNPRTSTYWDSTPIEERRAIEPEKMGSFIEPDGSVTMTWAVTQQPDADKPPDSQIFLANYHPDHLSGTHVTWYSDIVRSYPSLFEMPNGYSSVVWATCIDGTTHLSYAISSAGALMEGDTTLAAWLTTGLMTALVVVGIASMEVFRRRRSKSSTAA